MTPCVIDRTLLGVAHPVFDFGDGLLDRVEVGGVGRQESEMGVGAADGVADGRNAGS